MEMGLQFRGINTFSKGNPARINLLLIISRIGKLPNIPTHIQLALDGGFIISGITYSDNNTDGWLIKTDSRGNYKGMLEYP